MHTRHAVGNTAVLARSPISEQLLGVNGICGTLHFAVELLLVAGDNDDVELCWTKRLRQSRFVIQIHIDADVNGGGVGLRTSRQQGRSDIPAIPVRSPHYIFRRIRLQHCVCVLLARWEALSQFDESKTERAASSMTP